MYESPSLDIGTAKPHAAAFDARELFTEWREYARRGDFAAAWDVSDRALRLNRTRDATRLPRHLRAVWDGTPVEGRRVLVRCYHGLGDTIQFARFIPRLRDVAAEVTVLVQPQLIHVLSDLCEGTTILPADVQQNVGIDAEVEIMELAHVFRIALDDVETDLPYVKADPIAIDDDEEFRVGVIWRAGDWDDRRSIPFASVLEWTLMPGIKFYSLQQDAIASGWRASAIEILDANTIDRTAALMRSLDLIITVDTMTAHLAGALGRPVWTLLQKDADWRWMEGRDDSPWYPSMRLFRQHQQGDWTDVISRIATELRDPK